MGVLDSYGQSKKHEKNAFEWTIDHNDGKHVFFLLQKKFKIFDIFWTVFYFFFVFLRFEWKY